MQGKMAKKYIELKRVQEQCANSTRSIKIQYLQEFKKVLMLENMYYLDVI
jgi:hypothetical protein